ncbi:arylsulfatase B-like [Bolinopsis microptera]|uniref:arylsulfatase B-like n=1 Tax=Bolinopsis microptera TaxID=2820187 RepID=UPI003079FE8F
MPDVLLVVALVFVTLLDHVDCKQHNIVVIVADDLGYNDVGFRGSIALTPNIDRLANKSVILENHIVAASCSPTRSALMTGRYPIRTGFWKGNIKPMEEFGLGLDETLLPEMLKTNGYSTHGVGKWHLGMHTWEHTPAKRGFDTWFGSYNSEQDYFKHTMANLTDFRENYYDENSNLVDDIRNDLTGQYNTYLFTDKSVELIQNHNQSNPFFLYLAYTAPHVPHQASKEDVERFASHIPKNTRQREERQIYTTQISVMDEGIGKVIDTLRLKGMMDNTVLLFAYRFGSNYPLRGGKWSHLEGGVRAVSFVHSPLLEKSGYTNTNLHHVTDWYATFQKLAGDNPEKHSKPQLPIDGVDIWRSINNNESCRDEILYELRDPSKRLDPAGRNGLDNAKKYPINLKTFEAKFRKAKLKFSSAQDFFAIRWKNWKLLVGTGTILQGWTSESGQRHEYKRVLSYGGKMHIWSIVSGTFLFDLSSDVREEHNVADKYPDMVKKLLDKKQGYLDKMKTVEERNFSDKGKVDGVWKPWVEL